MGRPVYCYQYDLTQGMAKSLSRALLGQEIEGVWHASLVVGSIEYFYGYGIQQGVAGRTPFGRPVKVIELGETEVPDALIQDLLNDLTPRYRPHDYSFLWHNCTHFADELSLLLTGNQIPEYLTGQGTLVLEHPFLRNMLPMFEQMETVTGSATANGFGGASDAAQAFSTLAPRAEPFSAAQAATQPAAGKVRSSTSTQAAAVPLARPAVPEVSSSGGSAHAESNGVSKPAGREPAADGAAASVSAAAHSAGSPAPQPVDPPLSAAGAAAAARAAAAGAATKVNGANGEGGQSPDDGNDKLARADVQPSTGSSAVAGS